jgi:hypothetical protein
METETSSPNRAKAVDVSRDSTISSVSTASPMHKSSLFAQLPLHLMSTPLDLDPTDFHKVATGCDWNGNTEEEEEECVDKAVSGTRLNFNSILSPEAGKTCIDSAQGNTIHCQRNDLFPLRISLHHFFLPSYLFFLSLRRIRQHGTYSKQSS